MSEFTPEYEQTKSQLYFAYDYPCELRDRLLARRNTRREEGLGHGYGIMGEIMRWNRLLEIEIMSDTRSEHSSTSDQYGIIDRRSWWTKWIDESSKGKGLCICGQSVPEEMCEFTYGDCCCPPFRGGLRTSCWVREIEGSFTYACPSCDDFSQSNIWNPLFRNTIRIHGPLLYRFITRYEDALKHQTTKGLSRIRQSLPFRRV